MTFNNPIGVEMRNGVVTLVALSVIGWGLIIWSVANMSSPIVALMMPMDSQWAFREIIAVWLMWAVMMVLFVGGVMSLTTIAVLSGIVAIEKLAPRGEQISKLGGVLLIVWGLWLISDANGGHPPSV